MNHPECRFKKKRGFCMALIKCPECEKEISDKATACPFCGYPMAPQASEAAPESTPAAPAASPKKSSITKIIALVCAAALIVGGIAFGVKQNNAKKAEEAAAAKRAEYIDTLNIVQLTMLRGAADAESICNLTRAVWHDTIYKEFDSETFKYTQKSSGGYNSDFNVSLRALYADQKIIDQISAIEENQASVQTLMKKLQNPEEEFKICYETVTNMYSAYSQLTNLAVSPSGSFNTYSDNFQEYDNECIKYYEELKTQIPEK